MLRALLGIALVVGAGASTAPATKAPASFSLVLESTVAGWSARCDFGCRWKELSLSCAKTCGVVIVDANGVAARETPSVETAPFRFSLERTSAGVHATSQSGTAWQSLTWTCLLNPCRARVDAFGVSGIDMAR